jgi:thiamine pyrophosphokinase
MQERVLIVLSGSEMPPKDLPLWMAEASHVIAADGGANALSKFKLTPHTLLGDFDSIWPQTREMFVDSEVIHDEDESTTDFQKALYYALEKLSPDKIVVIGSEGDRLDHTFSALAHAAMAAHTVDIRFVFSSHIAYLFKGASKKVIPSRVGGLVSTLPLAASTVLSSSGLRWPLTGMELIPGVQDSVSNEATQNEISIETESGSLIVFVERFQDDVRW